MQEMQLVHGPDGVAIPAELIFGGIRPPQTVIDEAVLVAGVFQKKAIALELYQEIGKVKHLKIEGWQMLAAMYRVTASIESTNYIRYDDAYGFEATAVLIHVPSKTTISRADAMCLNDEDNWGLVNKYDYVDQGNGEKRRQVVGQVQKPLQQLRSMAQTRACSKVYSNFLKWVAKLSGFATTPAEEMDPRTDGEGGNHQQQQTSGPQRTNGGGPVISEAQGKRLWAIGRKDAGKTDDQIREVLKAFNFEHTAEITKAKYEDVVKAIQDKNWKPPAPTQQQSAPQQQQTQQQQPKQEAKPDAGAASTADDMWAEVLRAFKGDKDKARDALVNRYGFMGWEHVPVDQQTKVAMGLIEDARF